MSEERLRMFLEILAAMGGQSDASDYADGWVNAFCEPHEGKNPDTFNAAIDRGFARSSHDSDTDHSVVYITDEGRAWLETPPPDAGEVRTYRDGVADKDVETRLLLTAKLLYENALGCIRLHHGHRSNESDLPGWLADCRRDIEAADAAAITRLAESPAGR